MKIPTPPTPVDYASTVAPDWYRCDDCGARGVKLWREYETFLDHQTLRCVACALQAERKGMEKAIIQEITYPFHNLWSLIAAIPTQEGDTFWGYSSVPPAGVEWWGRLPWAVRREVDVVQPRSAT